MNYRNKCLLLSEHAWLLENVLFWIVPFNDGMKGRKSLEDADG